MYYGCSSEETKAEAIQKTVIEYRAAAGLFPAIRKVLEQFDGKVFNCRLEKALQEATGRRLYVKKDGYRVEIYYYGDTYSGGCSWISLAMIPVDSLTDGKRIPAALLIDSARKQREEHLKDAAALEENAGKIPEVKKQIKYFIEQANKLAQALPSELRDVYGIKYIYS